MSLRMRRSGRFIACTAMGLCGTSTVPFLAAQQSVSASALATITTDTGALAPGRVSFTRYTTPVTCLAAARNARAEADRTLADAEGMVMFFGGLAPRKTATPIAAAVARRCAARFTIATVQPGDLSYLFELALLAQDDSLAATVLRRRLSSPLAGEVLDTVVTDMMKTYLTVTPPRVAAVESFLTRDGAAMLALRPVLAMNTWAELLATAARTFDRARMHRYAEQIITIGRGVTDAAALRLTLFSLKAAYSQLATLAFVDDPASLSQVALRAQADLGRISFPSMTAMMKPKKFLEGATLDEVYREISPVGIAQQQVTAGTSIAPFEPTYWFPARPPSGKVTLILSLAQSDGWVASTDRDHIIWASGCLEGRRGGYLGDPLYCAGPAARIHDWNNRYGAALAITVATRTQGNALGSLTLAPRQEAERINWYFREHLKLPVTVATVDIPITTLPAPDGRITRCNVAQPGSWNACDDAKVSPATRQYLLAPATLLGARGELLYAGPISPVLDQILMRTLSSVKFQQSVDSSVAVPHDTL